MVWNLICFRKMPPKRRLQSRYTSMSLLPAHVAKSCQTDSNQSPLVQFQNKLATIPEDAVLQSQSAISVPISSTSVASAYSSEAYTESSSEKASTVPISSSEESALTNSTESRSDSLTKKEIGGLSEKLRVSELRNHELCSTHTALLEKLALAEELCISNEKLYEEEKKEWRQQLDDMNSNAKKLRLHVRELQADQATLKKNSAENQSELERMAGINTELRSHLGSHQEMVTKLSSAPDVSDFVALSSEKIKVAAENQQLHKEMPELQARVGSLNNTLLKLTQEQVVWAVEKEKLSCELGFMHKELAGKELVYQESIRSISQKHKDTLEQMESYVRSVANSTNKALADQKEQIAKLISTNELLAEQVAETKAALLENSARGKERYTSLEMTNALLNEKIRHLQTDIVRYRNLLDSLNNRRYRYKLHEPTSLEEPTEQPEGSVLTV